MAINCTAKMENYEVRRVDVRRTKSDKPFRIIRVESPDAQYVAELTVWDDELFAKVDTANKGDVCDFWCRFSAGSDYQGITLVDMYNHGQDTVAVDY